MSFNTAELVCTFGIAAILGGMLGASSGYQRGLKEGMQSTQCPLTPPTPQLYQLVPVPQHQTPT